MATKSELEKEIKHLKASVKRLEVNHQNVRGTGEAIKQLQTDKNRLSQVIQQLGSAHYQLWSLVDLIRKTNTTIDQKKLQLAADNLLKKLEGQQKP